MMKRRTILLALIMVALSTAPLAAQSGRQGTANSGDPVELLLNMRWQLHLSSHQVAALREIQQRLEAANRPLVERLIAIQREVKSEVVHATGGRGEHDRRPSEAQLDLARGPLRKIHENNMAAMEAVNSLLSAEQKRIACSLLQVRCRPHDRRPGWIRGPRGD
jgi:Spy/CpxP family protein refolding chaperone